MSFETKTTDQLLKDYCKRWGLSNAKDIASTFSGKVFKVEHGNSFAALKIFSDKTKEREGKKGAIALKHFDGRGAVKLLNYDDGAHLLEFIDGKPLKSLVESGQDIQATKVIAEVLSLLHSQKDSLPSGLITMEDNFKSLFQKVKTEPLDSIYIEGAKLAEHLIETPQEVCVLHGDIHHENILHSSDRSWLAIDPKYLVGERTYDLANTFFNPMGLGSWTERLETIELRATILSQHLKIDKKRMLQYAQAYGCLSASWFLEDGQDAEPALRIVRNIKHTLKNIS